MHCVIFPKPLWRFVTKKFFARAVFTGKNQVIIAVFHKSAKHLLVGFRKNKTSFENFQVFLFGFRDFTSCFVINKSSCFSFTVIYMSFFASQSWCVEKNVVYVSNIWSSLRFCVAVHGQRSCSRQIVSVTFGFFRSSSEKE